MPKKKKTKHQKDVICVALAVAILAIALSGYALLHLFCTRGPYVPKEKFNLPLRIADCATVGTDCEGDSAIEEAGCALEGATVTLVAENHWNNYQAELAVNSGEHSVTVDSPSGLPEWVMFKRIPIWMGNRDYQKDMGFYRITVKKDGYATKTGLVGVFGKTGEDLYWSREFIGNYICLEGE